MFLQNKMLINLRSLSLLLSLFFWGCSPLTSQRDGIDPLADVKAKESVAESFEINANSGGGDQQLFVDKARLGIKKTALNKEFLLSVNILEQVPTPMFSSLQSRVISFILRQDRVYLLDVTQNQKVGEANIPQNLLIAEFPVVSETNDSLIIDFNLGMQQIFTDGDMYASDDGGTNGSHFAAKSIPVRISYLDEIRMQNNAVFVRQIAQVDQGEGIKPTEVRYQIKPYSPDPQFAAVKSPGFDKVGYFEASPLLLKDGSSRVYAMKWNEKKKINFAISANTPAKYRDLLKAGLLYWNKILGDGVIEVTQLTDASVTAPQFDQNILQWVDWDAAGYAYADAHVDPRSGEVTSAQIFIPSAFTNANVPRRIRLVDGSLRPRLGLRGFKSARLCQRSLNQDVLGRRSEGSASLNGAATQVTPEAMDKAMRDYVYEVVAHELGHVLGLRHNFAGNLAANYDFKDRKSLIQSYYQNKKAPAGVISSSSVMEYSRFEESSWNGDLLQAGAPALSYDQMAIGFLYKAQALPSADKRPVFCTDSHVEKYVDCNMADAGKSVISSASGSYQFNLNSLAVRVINLYTLKSKLGDDPGAEMIPISEVNLDAKSMAGTLGLDLAKLTSLLKMNAKFIAVRGPLTPVLLPNESAAHDQETAYLSGEFNRLGGAEQLFQALPKDYAEKQIDHFNRLLEDPAFNSGKSDAGVDYSFSDSEKEIMRQQMKSFAYQIQEQLILNEIKALSGEAFSFGETYGQSKSEEKESLTWGASAVTEKLPSLLLNRFQQYVLGASSTEKLKVSVALENGTFKATELPVYLYSNQVRLAASRLLSGKHEFPEWAYGERKKATKLLDAELLILGEIAKLNLEATEPAALRWYLTNKKLSSTLAE